MRLPDGFPAPSEADLAETATLLSRTDGPALIDGLAFGTLPETLIKALPHPPIALCHHPLGLETGLSEAAAAEAIAAERKALALAAHTITPSYATKRCLVDLLGVAAEAVTVAPPGLDLIPPPPLRPATDAPTILTIGSLTPRKGHDLLIDALAGVRDLRWRAVWVGPEDRAPAQAAKLTALIEAAGLGQRIERRGALPRDALNAAYAEADIFCLPSHYEGYGMVYAEAMAHALPIVACKLEAFEDFMVEGAALISAQGDAAALASSLRHMLLSSETRSEAGRIGRAAAETLPSWAETWGRIAPLLRAA